MKIFLAKKVGVTFSQKSSHIRVQAQTDSNVPGSQCERLEIGRWASIPVNFSPEDDNQHEQVTMLKEQLAQHFARDPNYVRLQEHAKESWKIQICLSVDDKTPGNSGVSNVSDPKVWIEVHDKFSTREVLKGLRRIYGDELRMTVLVENFIDTFQRGNRVALLQMRLTEENIVNFTYQDSPYCLRTEIPISGKIGLDEWKQSTNKGRWAACVTVTAVVPDNISFARPIKDSWSMNKKLLLDQLCTDATIVAQNGVGVNCHKVFLSVHSPVLATMFQTAMQESQSNTVEMPDMTEASVRAFLDFIYCWGTHDAERNSQICVELLAAGHKYHIRQLQNRMEQILLCKNNDWYEVDVTVKLFLFSRKIPNGDQLKRKTIQVLKTKQTSLKRSPAYRRVFTSDPDAAMDLCTNAFAV